MPWFEEEKKVIALLKDEKRLRKLNKEITNDIKRRPVRSAIIFFGNLLLFYLIGHMIVLQSQDMTYCTATTPTLYMNDKYYRVIPAWNEDITLHNQINQYGAAITEAQYIRLRNERITLFNLTCNYDIPRWYHDIQTSTVTNHMKEYLQLEE